jgi:HEAT repeat protein
MRLSKTRFVSVVAALAAAVFFYGAVRSSGQTVPPATKEEENKLLAVLKSDAPQKDKVDACRQLGVIGTKDAVPVLAALLTDEKLSHNARYALEPIPDPSVDDALRDALGKVKERLLVGVIGSIGVRRDAKAIDTLAKLLKDADADVAQAAARALGKIGTAAAAKPIQDALQGVPAGNQVAFCEGLLRAAEALSAKGQRDAAAAIYSQLRGLKDAPHAVRTAVIRGTLLSGGPAMLKDYVQNPDYAVFAAAVAAAQTMPGGEVTQALCADLEKLPADRQILVMEILGKRGDPAAASAMLAVAKAGAKAARLAAIRILPQLKGQQAAALMAMVDDADGDVAKAAQESLSALGGGDLDAVVLKMLGGEKKQQLMALDLISRRRIVAALPAIMKLTGEADQQVRTSALRRVGELATTAELPGLLEMLMKAKPDDLGAVEQAVGAVCLKGEKPEANAAKLIALMPQAQLAQKIALLRVLGAIGGADALKAVREAVKDRQPELRAAAIRILGAWKTADAVPDLLALAENAADPTDKFLGLSGYLGWAAKKETPGGERLAMCKRAATLARTPEEKKLLLAALSGIGSPAALGLIVPHLDDAATRDEAAAAVLATADKLLKGKNAENVAGKLVSPLKKVVQVVTDANLLQRAKEALKDAESKAGGK